MQWRNRTFEKRKFSTSIITIEIRCHCDLESEAAETQSCYGQNQDVPVIRDRIEGKMHLYSGRIHFAEIFVCI
jgi:hypothetical protein